MMFLFPFFIVGSFLLAPAYSAPVPESPIQSALLSDIDRVLAGDFRGAALSLRQVSQLCRTIPRLGMQRAAESIDSAREVLGKERLTDRLRHDGGLDRLSIAVVSLERELSLENSYGLEPGSAMRLLHAASRFAAGHRFDSVRGLLLEARSVLQKAVPEPSITAALNLLDSALHSIAIYDEPQRRMATLAHQTRLIGEYLMRTTALRSPYSRPADLSPFRNVPPYPAQPLARYECIASDRSHETHPEGHRKEGSEERETRQGALEECHRYHDHCRVRHCQRRA